MKLEKALMVNSNDIFKYKMWIKKNQKMNTKTYTYKKLSEVLSVRLDSNEILKSFYV